MRTSFIVHHPPNLAYCPELLLLTPVIPGEDPGSSTPNLSSIPHVRGVPAPTHCPLPPTVLGEKPNCLTQLKFWR